MRASEEILGKLVLKDSRLVKRVQAVVGALADHPEASLPETFADWGDLTAAYRLFGNDRVPVTALSDALADATRQRCQAHPVVLVIQDTTSLEYTTHGATTGLGRLETKNRRGLFLHTGLAATEDGVVLGPLTLELWARAETVGDRKTIPIEGKESARWLASQTAAAALVGPLVPLITVADREADIFEAFALGAELAQDWVIRSRHDRILEGEAARLEAHLEAQPVLGEETVHLWTKEGRPDRAVPVAIRTATVAITPPAQSQTAVRRWWQAHPTTPRLAPTGRTPVAVNLVLVSEIDPPAGVTALRWVLVTSLPVATLTEAWRVTRIYAARWVVERFHFVLKSGCKVERLQLAEAESLQRAIVLYVGVAWWLLALTTRARAEPDTPCSEVVDDDTWQALAVRLGVDWSQPPTLREFVRAVAKLGGFLGRKGDGEPGVQTLWRGLVRLYDSRHTWINAKRYLAKP